MTTFFLQPGVIAFFPGIGIAILVFMVWSIFWKGLALWHAARHQQSAWFIGLLLINTAGILEIIYLFSVLKLKQDELFKA